MTSRRSFLKTLATLGVGGAILNSELSNFASMPQVYAESSLMEENIHVAVVQPVFTHTAYNSNTYFARGFYGWFEKYAGKDEVTDIRGLDLPLVNGWGWSTSMGMSIDYDPALFANSRISPIVITDVDVHNGHLFENDEIKYPKVVIVHSEYVTNNEYNQLKKFVSNGGDLIFLDGNALYAEVDYYTDLNGTQKVRLKKGHAWEVTGNKAIKSVDSRWRNENIEWIGGDYFGSPYRVLSNGAVPDKTHPIGSALFKKFGERVFTNYMCGFHENHIVTDPSKVKMIAKFNAIIPREFPNAVIAAYAKDFGKGRVFHFGIFGGSEIFTNQEFGFLLTSMINYERKAKKVKIRVKKLYNISDQTNYNEYDSLFTVSNEPHPIRCKIEIENTSRSKIDVSGWEILDKEETLAKMPNNTSIPVGGKWSAEFRSFEESNILKLYDRNIHFVRSAKIEKQPIENAVNEDPCN